MRTKYWFSQNTARILQDAYQSASARMAHLFSGGTGILPVIRQAGCPTKAFKGTPSREIAAEGIECVTELTKQVTEPSCAFSAWNNADLKLACVLAIRFFLQLPTIIQKLV
jgi:hypothetical protein